MEQQSQPGSHRQPIDHGGPRRRAAFFRPAALGRLRQIFPYGFRPALRAGVHGGGGARSSWLAGLESLPAHPGRHDLRPHLRHVLQSHRRPEVRPRQSAHGRAPSGGGRNFAGGRVDVVSWPAAAGLVAASYFLNSVCFYLSPVALLVICFYSLTKRFTDFTHVFLGLALALAPVGAWLAVKGNFHFWPPGHGARVLQYSAVLPLLLAVAVVFWLVGFDIIYAVQDYEFDRRHGLHSLVVRWGVANALCGLVPVPSGHVGAAGGLWIAGGLSTRLLRRAWFLFWAVCCSNIGWRGGAA